MQDWLCLQRIRRVKGKFDILRATCHTNAHKYHRELCGQTQEVQCICARNRWLHQHKRLRDTRTCGVVRDVGNSPHSLLHLASRGAAELVGCGRC